MARCESYITELGGEDEHSVTALAATEVECSEGGNCGGDFLDAEYTWTDRGWLIAYHAEGATFATSNDAQHPSLALLGHNATGEKQVIQIAEDTIDALEAAVYGRLLERAAGQHAAIHQG
jgi:hypothetical protein